MAGDPYTALLDQLTRLNDREAGHYAAFTARLTEITSRLTGLDQELAGHAVTVAQLTEPADIPGGYSPAPPPPWWTLSPEGRQEPVARLRAWVERVFWPGYGHLAPALGPCWPAHDLCLYGLDIASELWSALYLQPGRTPALLSAQAEYQTRFLPALAEQFRTETRRCGHPRSDAGQPWSTP